MSIKKNSGQELWRKAKSIIPGGNMLLSKRPEMTLPDQWPVYFTKSKGCMVTDLDGNEFIDMGIMGVGTNTLGYGHPDVDSAVLRCVSMGNMSSLNCAEEVALAEKLVEMHDWADMARFARSGGEANSIAVRIARAASGREKVAFCGYHGWHDWYLAANVNEDGLSNHLLSGLEPNGVPSQLAGSVIPFMYNDYQELERIVKEQNPGVIKMEVCRNEEPKDDFLNKVRELATANGIVLVFDECTSGFRSTFGGLHKKYGVEPDLAVFGKALGNGYAITSVIGCREVMEAAQTTFVSSTFWTERIGPSAALATLDVMASTSSWEQISESGRYLKKGWQDLAVSHGFDIDIWGLDALPGFTVKSEMAQEYKTLIAQEMLKQGYLSATLVYMSLAHSDEIIDTYFGALDQVFDLINDCENGKNVYDLLEGPVAHSGFQRLN